MARSSGARKKLAEKLAVPYGSMVTLSEEVSCSRMRGLSAQVVAGAEGRVKLQLVGLPLDLTPAEEQFKSNALSPGLSYRFLRKPTKLSKAALRTRTNPYSAGGIFDTGAENMLTGVVGLVRNIRKLTRPMEFEGISGAVFADRIGKADIRIGSGSRELDCYISASMGNETLVPGNAFGEGGYSFKGKDRMLYLKNETTKEKSAYPRDIVVTSGAYSPGFLQALSGKGEMRKHALFPMPDTAFVWHDSSRALVQTRAQKNAPPKAEDIQPPTPEPLSEGLSDSDAEPNSDLDPVG